MKKIYLLSLLFLTFCSNVEEKSLNTVTVKQFKEFINATAMGIPIPGVKRSGWEQVLNKNIFQKNIEDMLFVQMSNISTKTPSTKIIENTYLIFEDIYCVSVSLMSSSFSKY